MVGERHRRSASAAPDPHIGEIPGGGGNAAERTARSSAQIAKHTKRLVEAANAGGITFK